MSKFVEDLQIDESVLDKEWLKQPSEFMKISAAAAEARKEHDLAKLALDVTESVAYKDIVDNPESYGLAKTTEAAIKAAVKVHDEVIAAQKKVIEAKYEMDMHNSAVQAFDQRKRALENLVTLHGQSYFSTPVVKGANKEEIKQDIEESMKREVRRKHRRRKEKNVED